MRIGRSTLAISIISNVGRSKPSLSSSDNFWTLSHHNFETLGPLLKVQTATSFIMYINVYDSAVAVIRNYKYTVKNYIIKVRITFYQSMNVTNIYLYNIEYRILSPNVLSTILPADFKHYSSALLTAQ